MTKASRLRFVAKGVGAFFVFLVPFLTASGYFGGGTTGIGISLIIAMSVATGLVFWSRSSQKEEHSPAISTPSHNQPCSSGPYSVSPSNPTRIQLNIREGDIVDGHVAEVGGYNFSWFILDEENMIHYLNDQGFAPMKGETDVPASKVQFTVPSDGPWYLLLDVSGKQIPREVEAHLRIL